MTTRNARIAEIEVLFRAGNDRMLAWPDNHERLERGEALPFFCECGSRHCREHIRLTRAEYEAVRADPTRFFVAPGHDIPESEDIVERQQGYMVVQKHEDVRELVERMDLRRGSD